MKISKTLLLSTTTACVMGGGLLLYGDLPLQLPKRQPISLSPQIEAITEVTPATNTFPRTQIVRPVDADSSGAHRQSPLTPPSPGVSFPSARSVNGHSGNPKASLGSRLTTLMNRMGIDERKEPVQPASANGPRLTPARENEPSPLFIPKGVTRIAQQPNDAIPPAPSDNNPPPQENHQHNTSQSNNEQKFVPPPIHGTGVPMVQHSLPVEMPNQSGVALEQFAPPYLPSNHDADAVPWMSPYEDRAATSPVHENMYLPPAAISSLPMDFQPWWSIEVERQLRTSEVTLPVNVDLLTIGALEHAPQILALRTDPDIRQTYVFEERAEFDWQLFVESKWQDINEPIGNTLTTGGSGRFKNDIWYGKGGVKRRNEMGGQFELSQRFGYETQNSEFFIPRRQGTGRLQLSYTQPLLNGRGQCYNRSRMVLAQIETNRSFDEVAEELQVHLLKVTEAYWELYRARSTFLQRQKVLLSAESILGTLTGRQEVDALQRQVLRARAAVASRRTDIARSAAAIRNAESRLRLLVNDPRLLQSGGIELVPMEPPLNAMRPISMSASLQSALMYRPDVSQAIRDLRAHGVRLGMAEHEMLPKFDLLLEAYARGLAGDGDIVVGYGNQFVDGRPSYSIGFEFEVPLGNRAADARLSRRQQEMNRAVYEFRTVVETGLTDVELAVREVETTYREMVSQYQSLVAAETEASYLDDRWRWLPGDDRSTTLLLEDLLDAQDRLADTESDLVEAQVLYTIALSRLQKEMGTLLQADGAGPYAAPTEMISESEPTPVGEDGTESKYEFPLLPPAAE